MTPAARNDLFYILGIVALVLVVLAAAYFLS